MVTAFGVFMFFVLSIMFFVLSIMAAEIAAIIYFTVLTVKSEIATQKPIMLHFEHVLSLYKIILNRLRILKGEQQYTNTVYGFMSCYPELDK